MPLRPHQVGVARIVVDHQLVDLLQPVGVALGELLVLHAEPPVRIARGKAAVGRDRVELVGVDHFEDRGIEIEPIVARIALDLRLDFGQIRPAAVRSLQWPWSNSRS